MAQPIASGEWFECLVPPTSASADLERDVRRKVGAVPGWLARFAYVPWIARACASFIERPMAYASPALCDLVGLVVSQENSCRYCYGVQRAVLRIYGYRDEYIDRLLRDAQAAELSPGERAALGFARRLSRANPRPGRAEFDAVVAAGLARPAAVEVAAVVATANFTNRLGTLLALPPEPLESVVEQPLFRLMRPLMAWRMRSRPKPPAPPPDPSTGPCAPIVAALGDSPMAGVLRRIIDEAWASPILPRRTKALVLAVIARALDCVHAETEARTFLAEDGFAAADVDGVLATLSSPRLDAREARLVPFARETVRYQAATIQPRVREALRDFSPAETVEAIGIVALANAVCRLSVVLDAC
ncbi:MAG TPA: hypothetical protein VKA21_01040 [Candidatus Binatia bacterium]|nr:hypothetical protein [Candidatus Binatia bacterium]